MVPSRKDPLSAKYVLRCTWEGCGGEKMVEQNHGVRWTLGTMVSMDASNPNYGRCPRCLRHSLTVHSAPTPPDPPKPKGFTKIPEE
jgi:hypothetical protein